MKMEKRMVKEPFLHITKRPYLHWWSAWLIRLTALAAALLVSSLVIVILTKYNPFQVFSTMISGCFGSERKRWVLLQNLAMVLCISLAVTPAFKMRFWNLGAEGQTLAGGLAAAAMMFHLGGSLPNGWLLLLMSVAAVLGGTLWAIIPAVFKAIWNTNESLFTLMMNYVATQLVAFFIMVWVPNGSSVMGVINQSSKAGWLPELLGQKYLLNILVVGGLTLIMYGYLRYSKQGYEIAVVGESEKTARYIGISVKKVILRTMALSGALCGLAGFLLVAGTNHTISKDLVGGMGFTAIMVSWLAKFNPILMVGTSFLMVFMEKGAGEIATAFRFNESVADILTGIVIFFIIGCEFFLNYRVHFRKKGKEKGTV